MVQSWFEGLGPKPKVTVQDVFRALLTLQDYSSAETDIADPLINESYSLKLSGGWRRLNPRYSTGPRRSVARYGWLWFSGTVERDGKSIRYHFPAISCQLTVLNLDTSFNEKVGDYQVTDLVQDPNARAALLERAKSAHWFSSLKKLKPVSAKKWETDDFADLKQWAFDVAAAVGVETPEVRQDSPYDHRRKAGVTLHIGGAHYAQGGKPNRREYYSLDDLDDLPGLGGTALSAVYGVEPAEHTEGRELIAFRPLSLRQKQIASRVAGNDLAIVTGAPGTGKSHVLSVIAADAIARGESVLVVAGSRQAVDVLVDHFAKTPGPPPITFGGSRYGARVQDELRELADLITDDDETDEALTAAAHEHDARANSIRHSVESAIKAIRIDKDIDYRIDAVRALERAGNLDKVAVLVEKVLNAGLLSRRKLKKRLGSLDDVEGDLEKLRHTKEALAILEESSLTFVADMDYMANNEARAAEIGGEVLKDHWIKGLSRSDKDVLRYLAQALEANRWQRRRAFAELKPKSLTSAAPLWVGSLEDVDDVLPPAAGLFDLVILDEAAHIDQMEAAHVLVRAKRALLFGDPEQIGHKTSLTDEQVDDVARSFQLDPTRFNPKRFSAFDAAAARLPTEALDEHFRSAPHLIEFSSRRFYQGGLHTVTRNPENEAADHIDVSEVWGLSDSDGVNVAEVAECLRLAATFISEGWTSIGLMSPSSAQAEAINQAITEEYSAEQIKAYGLRIGTVRQFQGDERDVVIISYGVGRYEPESEWREVNDPHRFNVMVTRARERAVVVTSNPAPPGLAGEYVRWSEPLTDLVRDEELSDPWIGLVAKTLRKQNIPVRTGYRAGRYIIDVVAGRGDKAVAIDCVLHPEGPDAHIDRAMTLRRIGWRTTDALELKWRYRLDYLAEELLERFPDVRE